MAHEFLFQELMLRRATDAGLKLDIKRMRLLRHNAEARLVWAQGREQFDHYVSFQAPPPRSPYNNCDIAFQFVPVRLTAKRAGAMFVRAHRVVERWIYEGPEAAKQPSYAATPYPPWQPKGESVGTEAAELAPLDIFDEFSEKVLIEWSPSSHGTRSWSQWWCKDKPIVELRSRPIEDPFPGFQAFQTTTEELELLPASWQGVLSSVSGVYLLVCHDTGAQYVGSAYGELGFFGRWLAYAQDGHGGNKLLKARKRRHAYGISILEVCSSTMSAADIIRVEQRWKEKLGTRAFGLNAN